MDARRFAAEAGISEAEAERTLADAEREKEYIDKLHRNEFLNDMEETSKPGDKMRKQKRYEDPDADLKEIMREDARMASKAETMSVIAIILGLITLSISLLRG